jgi:5-methylthioribose kinase
LPELDSPEALPWLAERLGVAPASLRLTALGGGVSNHVYLAEAPGVRCVVKQSLGKLRVAEEWLSRRERIWRECAALRAMAGVLPDGAVPGVLFEDREQHIFAMRAASGYAAPWKSSLLAGEVREETARQAGTLLAGWIRAGAGHPEWQEEFGDLTVFYELRVDPYYRSIATRHPALARQIEALIQQCGERRISLVHGDYSPKNLLIDGNSLVVIDWEVVHWGDPAFDAAFLTNHLLLKAFHRPQWASLYAAAALAFWRSLLAGLPAGFESLERGALEHLGGLLLARIDGKSPVEYIRDPQVKDRVREAAAAILLHPPESVAAVFRKHFPCD